MTTFFRTNFRTTLLGVTVLMSVGISGCTDIARTDGVIPQSELRSPAGARQMYQAAVNAMLFGRSLPQNDNKLWGGGAFLLATVRGGLLTDELRPANLGGSPALYETLAGEVGGDYAVDARVLPERGEQGGNESTNLRLTTTYAYVYAGLQSVRSQGSQALGALEAYDPDEPALRAHLHALVGYAEVLLADLFCSGVPLSTVDFDSDYTPATGSSTLQVYEHAIAQFNQAIALAGDSARFANLAKVGKGRAYLAEGKYDSAAVAVHDVPSSFSYDFLVDWRGENTTDSISVLAKSSFKSGFATSVADRDGGTGRPFRTSGDVRTEARPTIIGSNSNGPIFQTNAFGDTVYVPVKYGVPAATLPLTIASGIEARLIEAEAALHGVPGLPDWLVTLNTLRSTAGISAIDPATVSNDNAVDTLFAERAAWLFLTAHRQGDLRRLVRVYHRSQQSVYPSGTYPVLFGTYGTDVNFPIPVQEKQTNPNFHGCLSRGA